MSDRVFLSVDGSERPRRHGDETNSQQLTIEERHHLRETQHLLLSLATLHLVKGKERKSIYIAPYIYYVYLKALTHGSHSFTCKYIMHAFPSYAFTRWRHH